ncbi:MAG: hypothetical protein ACHQ49_01580 [Elusimicrobiota bacterium]
MIPLARKTAASALSVALVFGALPRAAFSQAAASAPAATTTVDPAEALSSMQKWGVFKGDDDVVKAYLGNDRSLTPLGEALYLSLVKSHDPSDKQAILDEVLAVKPSLDALRKSGPYDARREANLKRSLDVFQQKFGKFGQMADGSVEKGYELGALREALMASAAAAPPPLPSELSRVKTDDGYDIYDRSGNRVYQQNQNATTTYNRELQKNQRLMNASRPPQVAPIPENGRYSKEMFDYTYWRMKNNYDALVENMRRDRMIALADLLGETGKFREDMWYTDKRIENDLIAEAKAKTYNHLDTTYSVFDLVDRKFNQRRAYFDGANKGIERYKADMDTVKSELEKSAKENQSNFAVVTDAMAQDLSLDERSSTRFLILGFLETQSYAIKSQVGHLDPSSPDSEQVMKAIDHSDMTPLEKINYKLRAGETVAKLNSLHAVLEHARDMMSSSDYAGSLDLASAALTSSQRELASVSADYAMFVQIPSIGVMSKEQADVSWMNFGAKFTRWAYQEARPGSDYTQSMKAIKASLPVYDKVAREIANGETAQARRDVIKMNEDATAITFAAPLNGDNAPISETAQLAASLKVNRDRIGAVFNTNKNLDAIGTAITWTVDMAVAGPVLRMGCNGAGQYLGRFTGEAAAGEASALSRFALVRRPAILMRETLLHTGARLQSLDPDPVWVQSQADNALTRYMLGTSVRAANVAMRQAAFTGMSAGISGFFTMGTHLYDATSQWAFTDKNGDSKVLNLPVLGAVRLRASDSMFTSDLGGAWEAFKLGAEGGAWWANTPMKVGDVPVLIPAMLGYVGLPATAFRDTSMMRYAELVGSRGVVGSGITATKWLFGGGAAVEGTVERGWLEKMALSGKAGYAASFTLGMADNVAKYAIFSDAMSWAGSQYSYHFTYGNVDPGHIRTDEENVELRIKGANASGQKWLASPAWMLIPTYAAHPARDAALYQRSAQGAEQYREAGLDHEIANSEEGARLRFLKTPEIPMSQRLFEASWKAPETGDYFIVTKDLRREAIKSEMVTSLGGEKAKPADINPLDFYRATKMEDGANFINLKVNDEVRLVAHQDFVESLLADPARAKRVLAAELGSNVEGFGRVTPEVQKDVAVALYQSEMQTGKPMPKELSGPVETILKPYLQANESVKPYAEGLIKALNSAPAKSEALDAAMKDVMAKVTDWKLNKSGNPDHPYMELVSELRASADGLKAEGKVNASEHAMLVKMYDYIGAIEKRFNAFNNVAKTSSLARESISALKVQYEGNPAVTRVLDGFSGAVEKWAGEHAPTDIVNGARALGARPAVRSFEKMIGTLAVDLEKSRGSLSETDFDAMKAALKEIDASPWVLHDSKGAALANWRPEQFESFMGALTAIGEQGRGGAPVRLFQMLKTGGGKTMLTFEGLLPLVEADAADRNMQPMFLTVQSNLEAQARMEFIAFKKIGSSLKFDTYEGFKTKIAEGKTQGKNVMSKYWLLGDEMDGAALQPALTIGQVTGGVAKRSPIYNRIEEVDTTLSTRLAGEQSSADSRVLTESRRAQNALSRLNGEGSKALSDEGALLENAAGRLKGASGPESRRAALADVRDALGRVEKLLDAVPSREADPVAAARLSLGRLKEALAKPTDAAPRADALKALEQGFAREENLLGLTGSEEGLSRLRNEAVNAGRELEGKVGKLSADLEAARASKTPDAAGRVSALGEELALAKRELAIVGRFRSEDAGTRLANLQERIADPGAAKPEDVAAWKKEAAGYESSLPDALRSTAQEHSEALGRLHGIGREAGELDGQIAEARREGRPAADLEARRAALDGDYATVRAEAARLKARLAGGSSTGDLGGMMRRLDVLKGRAAPEARAERAALLKAAQENVRGRLAAAADDVAAQAREGKPGWVDATVRLMERRRQMMAAFGGDENPMYTAFRDMKDDMQAFALNKQLQSSDPAVYKPAQEALLTMVDGKPLWRVPFKTAKMAWEVFTGRDLDVPVDQVGLTRLHAAKMLKALLSDPTMPEHQRDNLFFSVSSSLLWPGTTGKSSWVRTELLRQLHGFYEDAAGIRMDSRTGKINVVHNGQWFESMDNETRRFWELEYGVDLTLPYTNQSISTIKDVTTDKRARFISFSGTAGEKLRRNFVENGIRIEGQGSVAPPDVAMDVVSGPTDRFSLIGRALADTNASRGSVVVDSLADAPPAAREAIEKHLGAPLTSARALKIADYSGSARDWLAGLREASGDVDNVIVRRGDAVPPEAKPAIDAYLTSAKLAGKEDAVVQISAVTGPDDASASAARTWLRELRSNQKDTGLVVLSVSDTRVLKMVREYLIRVQGIKEGEIAMVFSDTEYLRNNVPEANVKKQMNLEALENGEARVLILDTRVGGRGLDLNFKGERGSLDPRAFRGYTKFEMLILDPQKSSQVHGLQTMGRIDVARVHPGASREFALVMDVNSVSGERVFRDMIATDPFFSQLRSDPKFLEFEKARGGKADWAAFHEYVSARAADGSTDGALLAEQYEDAVKKSLEIQQGEVEGNQLRSSSVDTSAPMTAGKFPGIEGMR